MLECSTHIKIDNETNKKAGHEWIIKIKKRPKSGEKHHDFRIMTILPQELTLLRSAHGTANHFSTLTLSKRYYMSNGMPFSYHFLNVTPDALTIMPDHIHGILLLQTDTTKKYSLSQIVGGYKSLVKVSWTQYRQRNNTKKQHS